MRTENSNYYYDITELNKEHLSQMIAHVTKGSPRVIHEYFKELEQDQALRKHIEAGLNAYGQDFAEIHYGRRLGWYALIRELKPNLVIETGVHQGVGACVIASALLKNTSEGYSGRYLGTDIDPNAGKLLTGNYQSVGEILYGDSVESLKKVDSEIDVFINDSDHDPEYEAIEYVTIAPKLSQKSVILGDNSHVTDKLSQFSLVNSREFIFFSEKPKNHWYPGAGIGISYKEISR
jgi:predicted O-methyltransferase YrrM